MLQVKTKENINVKDKRQNLVLYFMLGLMAVITKGHP